MPALTTPAQTNAHAVRCASPDPGSKLECPHGKVCPAGVATPQDCAEGEFVEDNTCVDCPGWCMPRRPRGCAVFNCETHPRFVLASLGRDIFLPECRVEAQVPEASGAWTLVRLSEHIMPRALARAHSCCCTIADLPGPLRDLHRMQWNWSTGVQQYSMRAVPEELLL